MDGDDTKLAPACMLEVRSEPKSADDRPRSTSRRPAGPASAAIPAVETTPPAPLPEAGPVPSDMLPEWLWQPADAGMPPKSSSSSSLSYASVAATLANRLRSGALPVPSAVALARRLRICGVDAPIRRGPLGIAPAPDAGPAVASLAIEAPAAPTAAKSTGGNEDDPAPQEEDDDTSRLAGAGNGNGGGAVAVGLLASAGPPASGPLGTAMPAIANEKVEPMLDPPPPPPPPPLPAPPAPLAPPIPRVLLMPKGFRG